MSIQLRNERIHFFNGSDTFTILHISDVHIWWSNAIPAQLEKIIDETNPDLVALTGDYSDTPMGATIFSRFMERIGEKYPVVFIGGNHDSWWGNRILRRIVNVSNCTYVDRVFFSMETRGGQRIHVGSPGHRTMFNSHKEDLTVLLIHNPEELKPADTENVNLVLAGHLHGGQIVLYKRKEAFYPGSFVFKHCSDRKQIGDTTLIVSRGAGHTFPVRIKCPKEVVLVTID